MKVVMTPMPVDADAETEDVKYIAELKAAFPAVTFQQANTTDEMVQEIIGYVRWLQRKVGIE